MIYTPNNKNNSVIVTQQIAETLIEMMNNNNEYNHFCNQIQIFKLISSSDSTLYFEYLPKNENKSKQNFQLYLGVPIEFNYQIKDLCQTILQYKKKNNESSNKSNLKAQLENYMNQGVHVLEEHQLEMIIRKVFNCLKDRQPINFSKIQNQQEVKPISMFYNIPQIDYITKTDIKHPFIFFKNDSLDSCPNLVDQQTYLTFFTQQYKLNKLTSVSKTQIEDSYILILIWQIKNLIQEKYSTQNVQLDYYPFIKTFLISRIDSNGLLQPLFLNYCHKIRFIKQCSQYQSVQESKQYFLLNNGQIETEFLDIYPYDQLSSNQKQVKLNISNYKIEDINKLKNRIKQIPFTDKEIRFSIEPKQFEFIHSKECKINDGKLIHHIIDLDLMVCRFCQQKISDATSLYLNIRLYEIYKNICDILMYGFLDQTPDLYLYQGQIKLVEGKEDEPDQLVWYFGGKALCAWYLDQLHYSKQEIKNSIKSPEDISLLLQYNEMPNITQQEK